MYMYMYIYIERERAEGRFTHHDILRNVDRLCTKNPCIREPTLELKEGDE